MAIELTNFQFDTIMGKYQQHRFENEMDARRRKVEAYKNIAELKELDDLLLDATLRLKGAALSDFITDIIEKRSDVLLKNGYPSDFLDIHYSCNICKDTGFIDNVPCQCFNKNVINLLYGDKTWTNLFSRENFDTFDFSLYKTKEEKSSAVDAVDKAKYFVSSILNDKTPCENLIISGNTGVGKTFLCNCIAKDLIENQRLVIYLSAPALFELFEKVSFGDKRSSDDYSPEIIDFHYRNIFECDLLIIDDLGTEYANSVTIPKLLDLVNKRLTKGPTLISTNLDTKGLKDIYSERFLSRIIGNYKFISLLGADIRVKKRINPPISKS